MPSDYDKLEAAYAEYLYSEGIKYIENVHYDAINYLDKEKKKYRSADGIREIKEAIKQNSMATAHILVSELKNLDILNTENQNEKVKKLGSVADKYRNTMVKNIDKIISENP